MARQYNYIYKSLVDGENDLYGQFAYNAYKVEKIKYLEEYKAKHKGKLPSDDELEIFHKGSLDRIPEYKSIGKQVADRMIKSLVTDQIIEMQANCMSEIEGSITNALENLPKPPEPPKPPSKCRAFWANVGASCVAAFLIALLPVLLALTCLVFNPDATKQYLKDVFHLKKSQVEVVDQVTN